MLHPSFILLKCHNATMHYKVEVYLSTREDLYDALALHGSILKVVEGFH